MGERQLNDKKYGEGPKDDRKKRYFSTGASRRLGEARRDVGSRKLQGGGGGGGGGSPKIMLHGDIALVRTFGNELNRETGEVSCNFENNNACPAASTLPLMGIYRNDNTLWLDDFKAVLEKMLVHGYSIDSDCGSLPCVTPVGNNKVAAIKIMMKSTVITKIMTTLVLEIMAMIVVIQCFLYSKCCYVSPDENLFRNNDYLL